MYKCARLVLSMLACVDVPCFRAFCRACTVATYPNCTCLGRPQLQASPGVPAVSFVEFALVVVHHLAVFRPVAGVQNLLLRNKLLIGNLASLLWPLLCGEHPLLTAGVCCAAGYRELSHQARSRVPVGLPTFEGSRPDTYSKDDQDSVTKTLD